MESPNATQKTIALDLVVSHAKKEKLKKIIKPKLLKQKQTKTKQAEGEFKNTSKFRKQGKQVLHTK